MKKLKKMPKPVKALPPAVHLEAKMREFKEAVPLFLDLKNEALRERYNNSLPYFTALIFFFEFKTVQIAQD